MSAQDSKELDAILSDVRRLLADSEPAGETPVPEPERRMRRETVSDETRMYTPIREPRTPQPQRTPRLPWEEPDFAGAYYGPGGAERPKVVRSAAVHGSGSAAARTEAAPAAARGMRGAPEPEARPAARREEVPAGRRAPTKAQRAARRIPEADGEDGDAFDEVPVRKQSHKLRTLLLLLLLLAGLAFGAFYLLARQPVSESAAMGARKAGVSTILLAGTDEGGARTDTLMLLNLNAGEKTASLVSIPRDTLVNGPYQVPKINGVYGINGGGEEGIQMLLQRVSECIGFVPDGYVLVDLEGFVELVDLMGGVKFNVPVDMYYNDPSQNLYINLSAGEQKLDGEQAMGLVRFRSGYAAADLERVNVQRAFVSAAADQWMSPAIVLKAPQLLAWLGSYVETDLSARNLAWVARTLMRADLSSVTTETLPGSPADIRGGSYYILSPYDVAALVNRCLNPYEREITVDDLSIRN